MTKTTILDDKTFERLFKLCPRVTVEIFLVNTKKQVLLVKRTIEPEKGLWHFPGGYTRLNETIEDAIDRKALEEIGVSVMVERLFNVYEYIKNRGRLKHSKGHLIAIAYLCKQSNENTVKNGAKFFSYNDIPHPLGFGQEVYVEDLHKENVI